MNCVETDALLSVADALGDQADRKLAHVAQCATCRSTLTDLSNLRVALAPEELPPHLIDRVAVAIEPLGRQRRHEKPKLALLIVTHFMVVAVAVGMAITLIGAEIKGFTSTGWFFVWPSEIPLAYLAAILITWRSFRSERARLRQAGVF